MKGVKLMSVIDKLAYNLGRNDEAPNQELARELAETNNVEGIKEVAEDLWSRDKGIQSDCIKVLYEVGYLKPELISGYVSDFLKLLKNKNNRLLWGGMIALSTIADIKAAEIYESLDYLYSVIDGGSVITIDNGVKILAKVAACSEKYKKNIFPYLINHLKTCRPKEVPQHSESILNAVNSGNREEYISVLKEREDEMSPSELKRVKRIYKALDRI